MAFGTAYLALRDRANLQSGQALLVLGAGGGVGLAAVQLGKVRRPRWVHIGHRSCVSFLFRAPARLKIGHQSCVSFLFRALASHLVSGFVEFSVPWPPGGWGQEGGTGGWGWDRRRAGQPSADGSLGRWLCPGAWRPWLFHAVVGHPCWLCC